MLDLYSQLESGAGENEFHLKSFGNVTQDGGGFVKLKT